MSALMHKVGGFAARRAPWVVAAWIVIAIGLVVDRELCRPARERQRRRSRERAPSPPPTCSNNKLPEQANGSVPIVLQSDTSLAQGQNMQAVESTAKSLSENQYVQQVVSPFDPQGAATDHQGRQDRLHRGGPEGLLRRPRRRRGEQRPRRGPACPRRGHQGLRGRLPRPAALQPEHRPERDHRRARRPDHPAVRLPHLRRRAAAGDHRDRRPGLRPGHRRAGGTRDRRPVDRPDPGDHARARGGNRLLPVHHQPASALPGGGGGTRRIDRPLHRHLGLGRRLRRDAR